MNIAQAKQEVINTVHAYLQRDETGARVIPVERQRPILLMGPPGIGKTSIMEQVAAECGINLVAYTITHHTRQSAIGLPFIAKRTYDGKAYSVTEYTMSEIIASIYDQIELSGIHEGILFLDEINCVSETLAPTMLQFLQYKTFGTHKVPDGFLIVTAGNPAQYNKSVREFDIVTLDRVKRIVIEEDLAAWKTYAGRTGIHGAILTYLEIRKEDFYSIRTEVEEQYFVTARGWEDLSRMIALYETMGYEVTKELVVQYLQDPEIAERFSLYYTLYRKYREQYRIGEILDGALPKETQGLRDAPFDERVSLIGLLTDALNADFRTYVSDRAVQEFLQGRLADKKEEALFDAEAVAKEIEEETARMVTARLIDSRQETVRRRSVLALQDLKALAAREGTDGARIPFEDVRAWFRARETKRQEQIALTDERLTHAFDFMNRTFGKGQEMVIFLTELSSGYDSLKFLADNGNESYATYNRMLLLKEQGDELRQKILSV